MADEDPTQAAREDVKPEPGAAGEEPTHLNLKVKAQDGNVVFFKAKPTTPFRKLMNAYCAKSSIDVETVNFMFDGVRLRGEQTPASVDMEDQDEIQVVIHQAPFRRVIAAARQETQKPMDGFVKICKRNGN